MIDLFALITFWSFVLAAYAIFPPLTRARVKLFVSWHFTASIFFLTSLLGILAISTHTFCATIYFCKLYDSFSSTIVYIILSIYAIVALFEIQHGRVNRNNIFRFKSSTEIFYRKGLAVKEESEGWSVLIDILYDNLESIFKMAAANEWYRKVWYQFWIKFLMPKDSFISIIQNREEKSKTPKAKKSPLQVKLEEIAEKIRRKIFLFLTKGKVNTFYPKVPCSASSLASQAVVSSYVLDGKLLELSIMYKPDFTLRVLEVSKKYQYKVEDITNLTVKKLLANTESYMYNDLIDTNTPDSIKDNSYQDRKFLTIFFSRDKFVDESHICRPVLQFVDKYLQTLHGEKDDPFNSPDPVIYEGKRFRNPILGGLLLYDWIVRSAFINKIEWHMFVMDIESWVEQIINNMTFEATGWADKREFPTQYFYILYEIFDTFTNWLTFVDRNESIAIKPLAGNGDKNSNMLQFIIETLPKMLKHVANSEMPDHHKKYLTDMVWRAYFDLKASSRKELHAYGKLLLDELIAELTRYDSPFDEHLFKLLISSFYKFDILSMHAANAFKEYDKVKDKFIQLLITHVAPLLPLHNISDLQLIVSKLFPADARVQADGIKIPSYVGDIKILFKELGLPETLPQM